jgi:hypothetical protein
VLCCCSAVSKPGVSKQKEDVETPALAHFLHFGTIFFYFILSLSHHLNQVRLVSSFDPPPAFEMSYDSSQRPLGDVHYNQLNASHNGKLFSRLRTSGTPRNLPLR